jgi:ADP-heptose:LPS heptosyltransferase
VAGRKRVLIIRDAGAVGDMLMITPAIRWWHEKGHEVDVVVKDTRAALDVLAGNPHVASLIEMGETGGAWEERVRRVKEFSTRKPYKRIFDVVHQCEHRFLHHTEAPEYHWSLDFRRAIAEHVSYYEHINTTCMECPRILPEMYPSGAEEREWERFRATKPGAKFVLIQLRGSSINKCYPYWPTVIVALQKLHPSIHIITTGDRYCEILEQGISEEPGLDMGRFMPTACMGPSWPYRRTLVGTKFVDLVVGPETGTLNAAACWDTP